MNWLSWLLLGFGVWLVLGAVMALRLGAAMRDHDFPDPGE